MNPRLVRLMSEISLIGVSAMIILTAQRTLTEDNSLLKLFVLMAVLHIFFILTRMAELSTTIRTLGAVLVFVWVEMLLLVPGDLAYGLPTLEALSNLRSLIADGVNSIFEQDIPIVGGNDIQIIYGTLIAAMVFLADWSAFVYRKTSETLVPLITLFLLVLYAGERQNSILSVVLILGALSIFTLMHRLMLQPKIANFEDTEAGSRSKKYSLRVGAVVAVLAIAFGVTIGPYVPGARSEAIVNFFPDDGEVGVGTRIILSPLIDLSQKLSDETGSQVFAVSTSKPSYWRLTALDKFDGTIWSSTDSYKRVTRVQENISPIRENLSTTAVHSFTISELGGDWAPVPYVTLASSILSPTEFLYNPKTASFITENPSLYSGEYYTITAKHLNRDRDLINSYSIVGELPPDLEIYKELPSNFPQRIVDTTLEITQAGETPFEKALILQDWFHKNFTYDENVPDLQSISSIENFLFNTKAGFCTQFAGSFAAMLRSIGIPTRVAVGFTPGTNYSGDPDLFLVTTKDAHAWVEVYILNVGWVEFEPTPTRGTLGENLELGGQVISDINFLQPTTIGEPLDPRIVPSPTTLAPEIAPEETEVFVDVGVPAASDEEAVISTNSRNSSLRTWMLVISATIVAIYLIIVNLARSQPLSKLVLNPNPRMSVQFAWIGIERDLRYLGVFKFGGETQLKFSRRVVDQLRLESAEMESLAVSANAALYGPATPTAESLQETLTKADRLHFELQSRTKGLKSLLKWVNPMPAIQLGLKFFRNSFFRDGLPKKLENS